MLSNRFALFTELLSATILLFIGIGPFYSSLLGAITSLDIVNYAGGAAGLLIVLPIVWKKVPHPRTSSLKVETAAVSEYREKSQV